MSPIATDLLGVVKILEIIFPIILKIKSQKNANATKADTILQTIWNNKKNREEYANVSREEDLRLQMIKLEILEQEIDIKKRLLENEFKEFEAKALLDSIMGKASTLFYEEGVEVDPPETQSIEPISPLNSEKSKDSGLIASLNLEETTYLSQVISNRKQIPKLSVVGIMRQLREEKSHQTFMILLIGFLAYISVSLLFNIPLEPLIVGIIILLLALNISGNLLFAYRTKKGWYGNNEREARDLIEFILKESESIDFTDGGKSKPILSEDDLEKIRDEIKQWVPEFGGTV